jgi:hypothetical protein
MSLILEEDVDIELLERVMKFVVSKLMKRLSLLH